MLSLRGSILLSCFFHIAIFVGLLQYSGLGPKRIIYKPKYQVRLVTPAEVPALAKLKKEQPKKVAIKKPAKKKVALKKKTVNKPEIKKKEPPPKKVIPKPKPAPVVEKAPPGQVDEQAQQALEDALARIRKKAEKRQQLVAADMAAAREAAAGWEKRQKEIQYHTYYNKVEQRVRRNWIPPQSLDRNQKNVMTIVAITLLPDGRLLKSVIEKTSGDPIFDQSVMRAILKSNPFSPPPIGLTQQDFELGLRFHSQPQTP